MQIFHDADADLSVLNGRIVAIIGYGSQGRNQALCLRDSGVQMIVGARPGKSWEQAEEDGFQVMSVRHAAEKGDILQLLLPDEHHGPIYQQEIAPAVTPGKTLCCSHGFAYVFNQIVPPTESDVIMVAPKGPGTQVRRSFVEGFSVPGLFAVRQDFSGRARATAMAYAKAIGLTRAGLMECTMEQETCQDLFGEQNVLCGGFINLMQYAFEVLTEAGYPPEMAYFECIYETKLIADLVFERGIQATNEVISNTAEWGEYYNGAFILPQDVKERMRESLRRIENGEFAREWIAEAANGSPRLKAYRAAWGNHPAELTGRKIRELFSKKES